MTNSLDAREVFKTSGHRRLQKVFNVRGIELLSSHCGVELAPQPLRRELFSGQKLAR